MSRETDDGRETRAPPAADGASDRRPRPPRGGADERWKVGELARRSGVSVRTLHHYDAIGLLPPEERTRAGHRLYGPAQARRLQQIASLRRLGLSLEEIAGLVDGDGVSLEEVLEVHVERLEEEIRRRRRLLVVLRRLREELRGPGEPELGRLAAVVAETLRHERYFTREQLQALALRRAALGRARMEAAEAEWRDLLQAMAEAMAEGVEADAPAARALARRARALVAGFTGGDPGIGASLQRMYDREGGPTVLAGHGFHLPAGLWEWMAEARGALERWEEAADGEGVGGADEAGNREGGEGSR